MKIRIEIDPGIEEQEVVIRCGAIDESITQLQSMLLKAGKQKKKMAKCFRNRIYAQKSVKQWISS